MSPIRFFRIALMLPIAVPLVFLPFGVNAVSAILLFSLAFGGLQYLLFACLMFYFIGRLREAEEIQRLSYWAPVIFIPIQAGGWLIFGYIERLSNPNLVGIWDGLIVFPVYILIVGYVYVGLVNLTYGILNKNDLAQSNTKP
jgi:hypothetical protein